MNRALSRVHENVCSIPYDDHELSEPQCTIVAGLVEENVLTVGWAGDSRLYIVNASCCRQVTVDDSWINDQVKLGVPKQIAMQSKDAHCITQCVGMRDDAPEFHIDQVRLAQGDLVLLCSDGLWNYAESEKEMFALVRSGLNRLSADGATRVQQCAALVEAMVNFANAAGGHDNISVCGYLHEGFDSLS